MLKVNYNCPTHCLFPSSDVNLLDMFPNSIFTFNVNQMFTNKKFQDTKKCPVLYSQKNVPLDKKKIGSLQKLDAMVNLTFHEIEKEQRTFLVGKISLVFFLICQFIGGENLLFEYVEKIISEIEDIVVNPNRIKMLNVLFFLNWNKLQFQW